jgi:hypothetical protein
MEALRHEAARLVIDGDCRPRAIYFGRLSVSRELPDTVINRRRLPD